MAVVLTALLAATGATTAQEANTPGTLVSAEVQTGDVFVVDKRTQAAQVKPRAGQTIRPQDKGRATIVVSMPTWTIDANDVRFERIDFVWEPSESATPAVIVPGAMLTFRGAQASFDDCHWQGDIKLTAGVGWKAKPGRADSHGYLRFANCFFQQLRAAIDVEMTGVATIECVDTLHVGPGPLVVLPSFPAEHDKLALVLDHTTLRAASGLVDAREDYGERPVGRIAIHAMESVFALHHEAALIRVAARNEPPEWLHSLSWRGEGNVVTGENPLVNWIDGSRQTHTVADGVLRASGIVRGPVQFAGDDLRQPAASRAVEWSAPLKSLSAPGISARHEPPLPTIIPASSSD